MEASASENHQSPDERLPEQNQPDEEPPDEAAKQDDHDRGSEESKDCKEKTDDDPNENENESKTKTKSECDSKAPLPPPSPTHTTTPGLPSPGEKRHHDEKQGFHQTETALTLTLTRPTATVVPSLFPPLSRPSTIPRPLLTTPPAAAFPPLLPACYPYTRRRPSQYANLLYLPMELQFLICSNLTFGELQTLRRTSRFYRQLINLDFIRICLGSITTDNELRFVCRTCMRYDQSRRRLIWPLSQRAQPPPSDGDSSDDDDEVDEVNAPTTLGYCPDPSVPLAGHCADCAVRLRQLCPGDYVLTEAGERKVRVCRWCGWPCSVDRSKEEYWPRSAWELHPRCAQTYQTVLYGHYVLVCLRSGVAFVTYILLWRLFGHNLLVVVPSIVAVLLMGAIFAIVWARGREVRTYHVVGTLEFAILALGIPPLYAILQKAGDPGIIAAEIMLVIHLVIRLINVLGNIALFLEYDVTKHHAPDIPLYRRLVVNPWVAGLIFWTSPRALENLWIGRGKHPRHKSFRRGMMKSFRNVRKNFGDFWSVHNRATSDIPPAP